MEYEIHLSSKRVEKEIMGFTNKEQETVVKLFDVLSRDPRPANYQFGQVNRNHDVKRIKCKRLRVFYKIDSDKKIIYIGKIENRDSKSYNMKPLLWFTA